MIVSSERRTWGRAPRRPEPEGPDTVDIVHRLRAYCVAVRVSCLHARLGTHKRKRLSAHINLARRVVIGISRKGVCVSQKP